jgi:hypothetical protein
MGVTRQGISPSRHGVNKHHDVNFTGIRAARHEAVGQPTGAADRISRAASAHAKAEKRRIRPS